MFGFVLSGLLVGVGLLALVKSQVAYASGWIVCDCVNCCLLMMGCLIGLCNLILVWVGLVWICCV